MAPSPPTPRLIKPTYPSFHWRMLFLFTAPPHIAFWPHVTRAGALPLQASLPVLFHSQVRCQARWLIRRRGRCELLPVYHSARILFQAPSLPPPPPPSNLLLTGLTCTPLMDEENKRFRTLQLLASATDIDIFARFWQDFKGIRGQISSGSVCNQVQNHNKLLTPFRNTPVNLLYFLPLPLLPTTHGQQLLS